MHKRLRELRADAGWPQAALGAKPGVSRQTINAIETGKYDPSLPLAFKIAILFKKPTKQFSNMSQAAGDGFGRSPIFPAQRSGAKNEDQDDSSQSCSYFEIRMQPWPLRIEGFLNDDTALGPLPRPPVDPAARRQSLEERVADPWRPAPAEANDQPGVRVSTSVSVITTVKKPMTTARRLFLSI